MFPLTTFSGKGTYICSLPIYISSKGIGTGPIIYISSSNNVNYTTLILIE